MSYLPRAHLRLDRGKGISRRCRASGNTTTVGSSTSQPLKCFRVGAQPTAKQTCLANAFHSADLLDARCRVDRRELCKAPACCPLPHPHPHPMDSLLPLLASWTLLTLSPLSLCVCLGLHSMIPRCGCPLFQDTEGAQPCSALQYSPGCVSRLPPKEARENGVSPNFHPFRHRATSVVGPDAESVYRVSGRSSGPPAVLSRGNQQLGVP